MANLHSVWKTYGLYNPNRMYLLPPSLRDYLRERHLAYVVSGLVDQLDYSVIEQVHEREERGHPPYHTRMMVKVLPYAECVGVCFSMRIARRPEEDVAFRVLWEDNALLFRTVAELRSRCLKELVGHSVQVLMVCKKLGLGSLEHASLDETKIRANASEHKAMSYVG